MISAKPILHAFSGEGDTVALANAGYTVSAENAKNIADAILKLKTLSPEQRNKIGQNGREYALKNHDYAKLAEKLANVLLCDK
jgi:glycosyltransferase involved in cell wall biosynthesis